MTDLPRLGVGSVLRRTEDGKRYVVRSISKVQTQPHTGFSQIFGLEPQPEPLVPDKAPRRKKPPPHRRRRRPRWF
jgi:hypothetical protein